MQIAIDVCTRIGARLLLAGYEDWRNLGFTKLPDNVEFVGHADREKRRELLSHAKGLFALSMYNEPFGNVAVEAMLSGCPVISSDWGAFVETNLHGVTGYRVRTIEQACWAARNIDKISPRACREWAEKNYSLERVALMYEEYFQMLGDLWGEGYYAKRDERTQLDWLEKTHP